MRRDPRLQALSREHHHALVLARRASEHRIDPDELRARAREELEPHFAKEERVLLPALRAIGDAELLRLVTRTEEDHASIRDAIARGDRTTVGAVLTAHVRFEERELFPACEAHLPSHVLDPLG